MGGGGAASRQPPADAMADRRQAKDNEDRQVIEMWQIASAGPTAILLDILLLGRNAELLKIEALQPGENAAGIRYIIK